MQGHSLEFTLYLQLQSVVLPLFQYLPLGIKGTCMLYHGLWAPENTKELWALLPLL